MAVTKAFAYSARDEAGKLVKGRVDATSEAAVVSKLKMMGISPISVSEAGTGTGLSREITFGGFGKHVGQKDLAVMSRQMATMIGAGLSLIRTLTILADQTENKELARVLRLICGEVEGGAALSEAFMKHPTVFPPLMIHLIRAGETGGFLDLSLNNAADNLEADVKLRDTIKSALTYPVIVLIMAVVAVIGMLLFIVPIFENMFADMGGALPLPTQVLVVLSKAMVWLAPALVIGGVAFTIWWRANKHTARVRSVVDPVKLKLPVFGALFTKVAVARFSRNFATMMGAGVPILQALSIVGETSGSYVVEEALKKVQESVRQGKSVAGPLAEQPVFPSMVVQMIAVGEDSGSMEVMLNKIAEFYEAEVESTTKALTSLIEPLMIAFIGVVIGGMIVALYLPVFTIFDQIK
ncbi:type II secretion system F family protein [Conyzicola sp.]|uniref:type II secretion system F family protein n=1 Tax=Conyzicola sp. TaxID=1969404 RepID=UPI00398A2394